MNFEFARYCYVGNKRRWRSTSITQSSGAGKKLGQPSVSCANTVDAALRAHTRVAFTGGAEADHRVVWDILDRTHTRHPDMVLLHGATPTGAERIAACWADKRGVSQVAFRPDWNRHGKAAPFKRNDQILNVLPIGAIVFPGTGIQGNLADKARKLGIPVWDFRRAR